MAVYWHTSVLAYFTLHRHEAWHFPATVMHGAKVDLLTESLKNIIRQGLR
jgi:hypothetical protein